MQLKTDGVVLSDYKIEDDRILTILSRDQGVLTAFANGANRIKTKLSASTELLCYSQFIIFSSRGRNVIDSAESKHIFFNIRKDVEKLSLASYFAELTKDLAPQKENATSHLTLLLNCLHFIENEKRDNRMLKALIELRLLTLSGYMPQLVACRDCGCFETDQMLFIPINGELVCAYCASDEDRLAGVFVSAGVLAAMRHIIYAPIEKLFSFTLSTRSLDSLEYISERYIKTQLEKTFPTLEFYRSIVRIRF